MDKSAVVHTYFMARWRQAKRQENWRQRQRIRRRRAFSRRQSRERVMFAMVVVVAMNLHCITVQTLWMKERSADWWDDVVKAIDWLENFRLSR